MTTVSGFEVRLGNFENMDQKIRWLRGVEPVLVSEGYQGGVITVSTGKNASYLPVSGEGELIEPSAQPDTAAGPDTTSDPGASQEPDATPQPEE